MKGRMLRRRRKRRRQKRLTRFPKLPILKPGRALFPNNVMVKLRYGGEARTIDPGAGILGFHVFSAGGMYDPDITGSGHQPRGFDELMDAFNHYLVIGAKITISARAGSTSPANLNTIGITLRPSSGIVSSVTDYYEDLGSVWKQCGGSSAEQTVILSKGYSPRKVYGASVRTLMADDLKKGSQVSNPIDNQFWHVWVNPFDGSSDTTAVVVRATIEYTAVMLEPVLIGQS